jgi:catechol 2,3-dioxygenase-like lactoylglutathione lyase family enzyme
MKRLHINLSVTDLEASIGFYTSIFAEGPVVLKHDYAKWMLDDPHVNFAISTQGSRKGIDHLGIQVENDEELQDVYIRLKAANAPAIEQGETTCCYARSEKRWIFDPEGIAWETFLTRGESPVYGSDIVFPADPGSTCHTGPAREAASPGDQCGDETTHRDTHTRRGCCI